MDVLADLNARSTYSETVAHEEIVDGLTIKVYACDTGLWMGQRDTYHRAEFDGEAVAIGQAGEGELAEAIAEARNVAAALAA